MTDTTDIGETGKKGWLSRLRSGLAKSTRRDRAYLRFTPRRSRPATLDERTP